MLRVEVMLKGLIARIHCVLLHFVEKRMILGISIGLEMILHELLITERGVRLVEFQLAAGLRFEIILVLEPKIEASFAMQICFGFVGEVHGFLKGHVGCILVGPHA